ncbi:unnamed protein product [Ectocarpus sp. 13 AM-2016]
MATSQNYDNDLARAVAIAMKKSGITFAPVPALKAKKNSARKAEARKKKQARALLRLQEDLVQKRVGVGGVVCRSGRPRAKRVRYDPSTAKKRVSPSKSAPTILDPTRSTVDDRVETARTRAQGRKQESAKKKQCNVIEFMKRVADPTKNKEEKYANTKGLLIAHGMGSGKTLTSLWVAKEYVTKNRVKFVNILAPNVAVGEFIDSFERAGITPQIAGKNQGIDTRRVCSEQEGTRV